MTGGGLGAQEHELGRGKLGQVPCPVLAARFYTPTQTGLSGLRWAGLSGADNPSWPSPDNPAG